MNRRLLETALEGCREAARSGRRPVFVFDVDDTLLSTNRRQARILREFAERAAFRERHPEHSRALAGVAAERVRYRPTDTAREAGLANDALLKELHAFWFERFFTNPYLAEDDPVPGAVEYCRRAREAGARLVYLTGRDEGMRPGTEDSLSRHGFPVPDSEVALWLKPRFDTPDEAYKADSMSRLRSLGEVRAAFENEPAHANLFAASFPKAASFLVETKHSGRPVALSGSVLRIAHFLPA